MQCRLSVLAVLALSIFSAGAASAETERLRIHGSNTLGARLVPALVTQWLTEIGYAGIAQRELSAERSEIAASRDGEPLIVEIDKRGTAAGITDLIDGKAEICMSSRRPTAAELEAAWQLGRLTSSDQEWVVALDGLALVVGNDNPVRSISAVQLEGLLAGRTTRWKELGGTDAPVAWHALAEDSGIAEILAVSGYGDHRGIAAAQRYRDPAALLAALRADPNGIALVGARQKLDGLRALPIEVGGRRIAPDAVGIGSEDYPLMRRLYFHTGQLVTALGRSFAVWVMSDAGQAVVATSEFQALRLAAPTGLVAAAPELPEDYRIVAGNAARLATSLRFATGLDWLDSRSRADLDRLAALLKRPENARRKLVLVGFTQPDVKSPLEAEEKSRERAERVAAQLRLLDAPVIQVRGFGGRLPLADPARPDARYRNERIEIWLR